MQRLRWQLTFSHLLATAFTLMSMIAAVVLIASAFLARQTTTSREPANAAAGVAAAIGGMVQSGSDPSQLNPVLRAMADGELKLTITWNNAWNNGERGFPGLFGLSDVAYIVVLDPSGRVVASSDPAGEAFAPPE